MLKGRDIIIVGQQAWDIEIGSNCKNIALEFSKFNRVLYVNPPLDRITKITKKNDIKIKKRIKIIEGKEVGLLKIRDNLWTFYPNILIESINWIKYHDLFSYLNRFNNNLFSSSIKTALKELNFQNYLLFNDSDIFRSFHLKELLKPIISIYYSRDNMIATDYWRRHGKILEPKLIQKSDLCVSNSEFLKNYCQRYNSNSHYVGQGCDLEVFKDADLIRPRTLGQITSPIIGYVGAITSLRLEIALIYFIAKSMPEWNIVLVGPEDEAFKKSELHNMENVHFLGPRNPEDLPQYINAFDVCINPQAINDLTIGNYPRKIDEYLALGKPTVATKTETMMTFSDYVFLAADKNEFIAMIKEALRSNSDELKDKRKEFAFTHSWENSVNKISDVIHEYQLAKLSI